MNFIQVAQQLTPDLIANFRQALETSKWPDGRAVSPEQKQVLMEALLSWEHQNLPEHERTGYMDAACASQSKATTIAKG